MGIFHAYDVRGLWPSEITTEIAYRLGRVFARLYPCDSILLGHDARLHSPELYEALASGLTSEGVEVVGMGLCSTPQLHFFQIHEGFPAGIMVTASHNPKDYHGFKIFDAQGGSISYQKGLARIEAEMAKELGPCQRLKAKKTETKKIEAYLDFLAQRASFRNFELPLVIDLANGSAGEVFQGLAARLSLKVDFLNSKPDGNFPAHEPNPLKPESRIKTSEAVLHNQACLGVVLDGDGDRIIFVDDKGEAAENYFVAALIAGQLLRERPQAAIVYDLISSKVLPEEIKAKGGLAVVSRVGYTFLYDKMVEYQAVFGAETSGHVYFKVTPNYYTESAAYALVVMLELLGQTEGPLSQLLAPLKSRYYQAPELNIRLKAKAKALQLVKDHYRDAEIAELDGVSVSYPDFWFNVRPSNTEPLLRVRLEASNKDIGEARLAELERLLKQL